MYQMNSDYQVTCPTRVSAHCTRLLPLSIIIAKNTHQDPTYVLRGASTDPVPSATLSMTLQ